MPPVDKHYIIVDVNKCHLIRVIALVLSIFNIRSKEHKYNAICSQETLGIQKSNSKQVHAAAYYHKRKI